MSTDRRLGDVCNELEKIRDILEGPPSNSRDLFAAAALSVISWGSDDETARRAFEIADAMMRARHERSTEPEGRR